MTWHQSIGHIGPVLRLRCIGTERAQTQLLLYTVRGNFRKGAARKPLKSRRA